MFAPFNPFWIRKPVPVLPSLQFPSSMHHPTAHHPTSHHSNFNANFNIMDFRGSNHAMIPTVNFEKLNNKKDIYDNTIQSIKSELMNNNTTLIASSKMLFSGQEETQNANASSFADDEFTSENIDVETDSDTDQQLSYQTLSDQTVKHEEWRSKIVKSSMSMRLPSSIRAASNASPDCQAEETRHDDKVCILSKDSELNSEKNHEKSKLNSTTRVCSLEDDDAEYFNESFTNQNLLTFSDRKRGKYGNGKGFSIENIIGRLVEDR